MSRVERHVGKLRKIDLNGLSVEEWCKKCCASKGMTELGEWDDDFTSLLLSDFSDEYIQVDNDIYEIIEDKEEEESDFFINITESPEGVISYVTQFYNGGTCLSEMLEYGLIKFNNK